MISTEHALLLGLLSEREHNANEMAQTLSETSLAISLWSVSRRTWYRYIDSLVEAGLAEPVVTASRSPMKYRITDAGREALLSVTDDRIPDGPGGSHRNEVLARIYAAGGGDPKRLRATLEARLQEQRQILQLAADTYRVRAENGPTMPDRSHVSAMLARLISDYVINEYQWTKQAIADLEHIDDQASRVSYATDTWNAIADKFEAVLAREDSSA